MIFDFWCPVCSRNCDLGCKGCSHFADQLISRITTYDRLLMDFKDFYDDIHDDDSFITHLRMNNAYVFDNAICLWDDVFNDEILRSIDDIKSEYYLDHDQDARCFVGFDIRSY